MLNLPVIEIAALGERNWGEVEGKPRAQVRRDITPPGGETPQQFSERVLRGCAQIDARGLPLRFIVQAPSCVPAAPGLEIAGADFQAAEIRELFDLYDLARDEQRQLEEFLAKLEKRRSILEQQREDIEVMLNEIAFFELQCKKLLAEPTENSH